MKGMVNCHPAMKKGAMVKKPSFQKKREMMRQMKGNGAHQKRMREDEDDDLTQ